MRAAGPLLQLLGRLRVALLRASFASLMEQVAEAIKFFEKDIRSAGISEQQANSAKYILCATADDIVQHIPTEERHVWTQYSMLSRFFGERIGGVRFFEILNHAKIDPLINYPVLELQHACLALGFQGVHRTQAGGLATLQQIQRDLYETLRRVRPKVIRDLSPHWQGQALGANINRVRVPVWVVGAIAAALLFGLFVTLRILLSGNAEAGGRNDGHAAFERRNRDQAPRSCAAAATAAAAATRIAAGALEGAGHRLRHGRPDRQPDRDPALRPGHVRSRPGGGQGSVQAAGGEASPPCWTRSRAEIRVVGHTDNTPIKNVRFPSNWVLSVERAKAVAALLKAGLHQPDRIESTARPGCPDRVKCHAGGSRQEPPRRSDDRAHQRVTP